MPRAINALTVDVEDWYQGIEIEPERWAVCESRIEKSLSLLLEMLAEAGVRATFFILGRVAEQQPALVKKIDALGHEIGTHGYSHRLIYKLDARQFAEELQLSIDILQELTGRPVKSHRAAFFSITNQSLWALDILLEKGLAIDSSIFPIRNYRYGIADAPRQPYLYEKKGGKLLEFPISTLRLFGHNLPFSGGFYLRLLPYPLLHRAFAHLNRKGHSAVVYIHPWELDSEHPHIPLPRRIALPHYHNLRSTEGKLRRLLKNFSFAPLEDIAKGEF